MGLKVMVFEKKLQTMGLKVRKENKITYFFLIKITKMYDDNFFYKFFLGLWTSYTLINKKKITFLRKHITRIKK
jgi:hypothetical protein